MAAATLDRVIYRQDLCLMLGISSETVRRWMKTGKLPKPDVAITRRTLGWRLSTLHAAGITLASFAESPQPADCAISPRVCRTCGRSIDNAHDEPLLTVRDRRRIVKLVVAAWRVFADRPDFRSAARAHQVQKLESVVEDSLRMHAAGRVQRAGAAVDAHRPPLVEQPPLIAALYRVTSQSKR